MKKCTIGFIGYGNMAKAIVSALASDSGRELMKTYGYKVKIAVSDSDESKLSDVSSDIAAVTDNEALVSACDAIVLAIKPQNALEALKGLDFGGKLVISIMASVTIAALKKLTGNTAQKLVRVMPNLNARVGSAYSAFCTDGLSADEKKFVFAILSSFGDARELNERHMNVATGLCGSGPAFVFKFIDSFVQNALKNGLNKEIATEMALSTIIGSAYTVGESLNDGISIDELVQSVCSKGGTTIEGVNYLNEKQFESVVSGAIDKAILRAEEMSKANEER